MNGKVLSKCTVEETKKTLWYIGSQPQTLVPAFSEKSNLVTCNVRVSYNYNSGVLLTISIFVQNNVTGCCYS
jgi:hypothetical protein